MDMYRTQELALWENMSRTLFAAQPRQRRNSKVHLAVTQPLDRVVFGSSWTFLDNTSPFPLSQTCGPISLPPVLIQSLPFSGVQAC